MGSFLILLDDMRFYSRIGVFGQERRVGNEFSVSMRLRVDATAFRNECLDTTVSYAHVYELVRARMGEEWLLLESVAKTIADDIHNRFENVTEACVRIDKLAPPIAGIQGTCGVEYDATF